MKDSPCTPKQLEVAQMLADGLQHPDIATLTGRSLWTIRRLTFEARARTGTHTSAAMVAFLMRRGWIK